MVAKYFNKDINEAANMQIQAIDLINNLFKEVNPIPIKVALKMNGYNFGRPRMPLTECSEGLKKELKQNLDKIMR